MSAVELRGVGPAVKASHNRERSDVRFAAVHTTDALIETISAFILAAEIDLAVCLSMLLKNVVMNIVQAE